MQVEAIYSPTIQDGAVIRFRFGWQRGSYRDFFSRAERTNWSAEINASRNGVSMNGDVPVYNDDESIRAIQRLLSLAWDAYQQMRKAREPHDIAKAIVETFNEHDPLRVQATAEQAI